MFIIGALSGEDQEGLAAVTGPPLRHRLLSCARPPARRTWPPQEATARYRTLDPQVKLQLAARFMRPGDPDRRR
jgi:hypothetical protein